MNLVPVKLIALTLTIAILSQGCGKRGEPQSSAHAADQRTPIIEKMKAYLALGSSVQDADGFIDFAHCDSLLFSGLYGVGGGAVRLEAARDSEGRWFRRSMNQPACYPAHSASTISRDMLLGALWWMWEYRRLDLAEDLFAYGESHDWIMGEGDISRIYFTPGLQATLAEMIYRMGGKDRPAYRAIPQSYAKNTGFAAHLDALHILLRGELVGSIDAKALEVLKYNYDRASQNALLSYAWHRYSDGDQSETYSALLNEAWWPSDRLPTSADRCEGWITQRDPGADWQPCDSEAKTHSGGDFLFVAKLLLRS